MKSDQDYESEILELTYEIDKYKKALIDSGFDYYDFNLQTGQAEQSFIIGESLGLQPDEYDTMEKRSSYFHPDDLKRNLEEINRAANGEIDKFDVQSRLFRKDGTLLWLQHTGTISRHPVTGENHLVGILRDITTEKANVDYIKYLAEFDGLTGAYNSRGGLEQLERYVDEYKTVTIIYIDLDEFKWINDNYGHQTGDNVLKEFCKKMNTCMPKESFLVRLGGDEFLCVIPNQNTAEAKETVDQIMSAPVIYGNDPQNKLFFSYGIATFDREKHDNLDLFIRDADEEMYRFKKAKKYLK